MSLFPKVQRPCPYKGDLSAVMDGDHCRMCDRQVIDLMGMTSDERVALIAGCADEICVSYRLPVRPALAAAALAASAVAMPAYAQTAPAGGDTVAPLDASEVDPASFEGDIIIGGIDDPANTEFVEDAADANIPAMPVIYEKSPKPLRKSVRVTVRRKA